MTQGLSSKLHIGMRHHLNGLLRVTWFWRVWLSGESFFTNNGIHTDVSITTFHCMWHKVCPVSFTLVWDITPMVFWGSRDSEGCGYQVSRLLLIIVYILTWVSLHFIVSQGLSSKLHIGMRHAPMVFWGSRDSEGCGYQVSRLLLIMIYILTWVSLHFIVCDTRFVQ